MSTPEKRALSQANQAKVKEIHEEITRALDEVLTNGWHGTAGVEFIIADGTIQQVFRLHRKAGPPGNS